MANKATEILDEEKMADINELINRAKKKGSLDSDEILETVEQSLLK